VAWGFRKSFSFGGARVTFSRRGVTTSWGTKHFRVTSSARGTYVTSHVGNFYYRTRVDQSSDRTESRPRTPASRDEHTQGPTDFHTVGDLSGLTDASHSEFVDELNRATSPRWRTQAVALALGVIAFIVSSGSTHAVEVLAYCAILVAWARHADNRRRRYALLFDLDPPTEERWTAFRDALLAVGESDYLRSIKSEERHGDRRRHGGATAAVSSERARISPNLPRYVMSNVVPVEVVSHDAVYYFFPDRLLAVGKFGWTFAATSYDSLSVGHTPVEFTWDTSSVPGDATVLRETWHYVRNDGRPDRRFANNFKTPVLSFSELTVRAVTGLSLVLMASRTNAVRSAVEAIDSYGRKSNADTASQSAAHADPQVRAALGVFGLAGVPDEKRLRTLYRDLAARNHPDRFASMPAAVSQMANLRMQEINAAYAALRGLCPRSSDEQRPLENDTGATGDPVTYQAAARADRDRGWIWAVAAALALFATARVLNMGGPSAASAETTSAVPMREEIAISITGAPAGAKILVDGEPQPLTFSLPKTDGHHTIEISAAGYVSYHGTLDGSQGANLVVSLARLDTARRKRPTSSRPPVEQAAAEPPTDDTTAPAETREGSPTDISAKEPGTPVAGSKADQPDQHPSIPSNDEHATSAKDKWVDPFADEPTAKAEKPQDKKWVDPFSE
jgi:hypothetical protein